MTAQVIPFAHGALASRADANDDKRPRVPVEEIPYRDLWQLGELLKNRWRRTLETDVETIARTSRFQDRFERAYAERLRGATDDQLERVLLGCDEGA